MKKHFKHHFKAMASNVWSPEVWIIPNEFQTLEPKQRVLKFISQISSLVHNPVSLFLPKRV